jgi:hypothetical protein
MLKHQYKVLAISLAVGFIWVGVHQLLLASWFFSRLSIFLAVISFVPAALVFLVHGRELGTFFWWDKSNVVLTTRRPPKVEKTEFIVMTVLWSLIFVVVVVVIFFAR